jgi:crotonobetainyl-CoA:carnitine CoA-transferase CaiB-like acyl-CoA transferase
MGCTDTRDRVPALGGLRVLDLSSSVAGALAAMCLGDYGAEVLRVELPGSIALKNAALWHRNKAVIEIDWETLEGARRLGSLFAGTDCVIFTERVTTSFGTAHPILLQRFEQLVKVVMPPFARGVKWPVGGESAEFAGALAGFARRQSSVNGGPVESVFPHVVYEQGLWAATVAVAALVERQRSGLGQTCEIDGMHGALVAATATMAIDPSASPASTAVGPGGPNPVYSVYKCADGLWLFFGALTPKFQDVGFDALGISDVLADARIGESRSELFSPENRGWVRARIAQALGARPRDEWLAVMKAAGCPAAEVGKSADWLDHPQITALGLRKEIDDPEVGPVVMPGAPVTMTRSPACQPEARRRLDAMPDWSHRSLPVPVSAGAAGNGPLDGVRVIDLGTVLAGPYAGTLLAELGADVMKVEPLGGDTFRTLGFHYNRGQRSLAIDLRNEQGRDAFLALAHTTDVVIDNYRPGVLEKLRISYDDLVSTVREDIITTSISGYGDSGPLAAEPGFDPSLQAMSGMMAAQGGSSDPVFFTMAVNDVTSACAAAFGTCVALYHRLKCGAGQRVQITLTGMAAFMQAGEIVRYRGHPPMPSGSEDYAGPSSLDRYYQTADGYIRLRADCVEQLVDAGLLGRAPAPAAVEAALLSACSELRTDELIELLESSKVVAVPALTTADLPHVGWAVEGRYLEEHSAPDGKRLLLPGRYARLSRTERTDSIMPPGIGEHTTALLREAGLDSNAINALFEQNVVAEHGPMTTFSLVRYR